MCAFHELDERVETFDDEVEVEQVIKPEHESTGFQLTSTTRDHANTSTNICMSVCQSVNC